MAKFQAAGHHLKRNGAIIGRASVIFGMGRVNFGLVGGRLHVHLENVEKSLIEFPSVSIG